MRKYKEAKVVAEIGCNHLGSMDRAKHLIDLAKLCGADYAKFQKRNPEECVPEHLKYQPHPNQIFAHGKTYLEHRKNLEFSIDQHVVLFEHCKSVGIKYSCSVWDITSAREISFLNPEFIKIPSACNHNRKLIEYLISYYQGDIHVSTGMSSHDETANLLRFVLEGDTRRFVMYHCTSMYPCPFEKLHLLDIQDFAQLGQVGLRTGFSNHGYGIAADIAAYTLGAEFIERHFVDDRTIKHTDAAASLEPEGMRRLCRDLKNIRRALTLSPSEPDEVEIQERSKLRVQE
jgi:N-acetylneuraminate synthase